MYKTFKFLIAFLCISLSLLFSSYVPGQGAVNFPLKLSDSKRYLTDQSDRPFLIKEISAWGLIQGLSEKDASAFLDSIIKKGFNTVLTCIINNHRQMVGRPPYWQGISPFKVQWDFSSPNTLYFDHVDRFLKIAHQKGVLVLAVPVYLGYRDDGGQGWWDELKSKNNDTLKMRSYGEYLGHRYKDYNNIIWVAGGDNNATGDLFPYELNMIEGIKSKDHSHYWTGHFDSNLKTNWSTENVLYAHLMDIDGEYVWSETVLEDKGPQYKTELNQYTKGKMIFQMDQSYEHDSPHFADNENAQWIRRKMYEGLLSGCAGTSFSPGTVDNQCYTFKNWKSLMNTPGMNQARYCFKLFESRSWEKLVPDTSKEIILSGRGTSGDLDYICAAKANDGSTYILYIPHGHIFSINIKRIADSPLNCFWYNPVSGTSLSIGTVSNVEKFYFATPSPEDWILVLDKADLKLPKP